MGGPFPTASWNGQQYFITFIDDYSHYGYLYLIHEKSQSLGVFNSIKLKLKIKLERKFKSLNLTVVVSTIVDMMDQVNNIQDLLQDTYKNVALFLNTPCQGLQIKIM